MSTPTPQQVVKIERLAEALENIATIPTDEIRKELRLALVDFLIPAIRVVEGGRQEQVPDVFDNIVMCKKCSSVAPCKDTCDDWAATVRDWGKNIEGGSNGSAA